MPNTEWWMEKPFCTEIDDYELFGQPASHAEHRIEAILAHHRELIVKEIRGEIEKNTDRYKNFETMDEILCLPCLQENE